MRGGAGAEEEQSERAQRAGARGAAGQRPGERGVGRGREGAGVAGREQKWDEVCCRKLGLVVGIRGFGGGDQQRVCDKEKSRGIEEDKCS